MAAPPIDTNPIAAQRSGGKEIDDLLNG